METNLIERFVSKVEKTNSCWLWKDKPSTRGYGRLSISHDGVIQAHRLSYELHVGEIPDNHVIHHKCKNKNCVNPDHLEAITQSEHIRKEGHIRHKKETITHCPQGHEYTFENTQVVKTKYGTGRQCRQCGRDRWRKSFIPHPKVPKTHCPQGHPYSGENLKIKDGYPSCKQCARDYANNRYWKMKAASM